MSSDPERVTDADSQTDAYEAAVLDFLDKELAAAERPQLHNDQSDELDALVTDLLRRVISESDRQTDSTLTAPAAADAATTGQPVEPQEDHASESNLLADLNRSLSQTYNEKDLCESSLAGSRPCAQSGPPHEAQQPSLIHTYPLTATGTGSDATRTPAPAADEESEELRAVPADHMLFKPVRATGRRLPMMALVSIGLMILTVSGAYLFLSFKGNSSKSSQVAAETAPAVVTQQGNRIQNATNRVETGNAKVQKVSARRDKASDLMQTGKTVPTADVRKLSSPGKDAQASGAQITGNHPRENIAATSAPLAIVPMETITDVQEAVIPEKTAAAQPVPTQPVTLTGVAEEEMPLISHGNGNAANASAVKTPIQPILPMAAKVNDSATEFKVAAAAPAQSRLLVPATPISQPSPSYPEIALRTRTSGSVVLDLQIDENGRVTKATPVSGPALLHQAAIAAALKWRYKPASIDGKNVPSQARVTMNFSLNK